MFADYVREGMDCLLLSLRPALLIYAGHACLKWGRGKKIALPISMIGEYLWLVWLIAILHAARLVGPHADWSARADLGIGLYRGGPARMLAGALLFVPYGFFFPFVRRKSDRGLRGAALLGALTSAAIAALRLSLGLGAAVSDVLMGAAGTALGDLLSQAVAVAAWRACLKNGAPIDSPPG